MWLLCKTSSYSRVPTTLLLHWRLCVACYCLTTPTEYPQHYKRHVCGPFCSCKHQVLWISPIFEHYFCLNYMGTVRHWQTFWSRKSFCFTGHCWYFNPQWTPEQAIIVASSVTTVLCQLKKMHSYKVSTNILVFVEGFRRWRGYIMAPEWKPDLQGSCSIASHSS
jgi:hypothetical protein